MKTLGFGIACAMIVVGCGPTKQSTPQSARYSTKTSNASQAPSPSSSKGTPVVDDDAGNTPKTEVPKLILVPRDTANIGPANLYCSLLSKPTASRLSASVACRFEDEGKRVGLTEVAETVTFAAKVATDVTYNADTRDKSTWDVVYTITGKDLDAILKTSLTTLLLNTVSGENRQVLNMPLSNF